MNVPLFVKRAILLLSVIGIGISLYLTYVKLTSSPIVCGFGNCEKVQTSKYSQIAGIPVAVFGLFYYFLLFCLTFYSNETVKVPIFKTPSNALNLWVLWGIVFSSYLTYLEIFVIKAICLWCAISFADILLVAVLKFGVGGHVEK